MPEVEEPRVDAIAPGAQLAVLVVVLVGGIAVESSIRQRGATRRNFRP